MKPKPTLSIILERGRTILKSALNHVIAETALPAYLIEGLLLDLLAEVRAQKAAEIAAEYEDALKQISPPSMKPVDKTDTAAASEDTNND